MVVPAVGEIVLVPFPFSDLSVTKIRPALCLADAGRGDWVLAQITSSAYGDPMAIALSQADCASCGLRAASFVRPGKLFTSHNGLLIRSIGKLGDQAFQRVIDAVIQLLQTSRP